MRKKEITPLILTKISVNRNNSRVKRPASLKLLVFLSLLLILSFVLVFLFSDRLSVNQSTIIGVAGATFISILYSTESRQSIVGNIEFCLRSD